MSRCFPFPPPGYEKKIRTDEPDSLLKEKQKKEKKHKKDKEKKEGKERKDKETSKDKHKDRKEKKEKHKDKKDKEKSKTSEDKNAACVLPNTKDREQLVTDTVLNNGNGESKFIQDLARRIRDEEATNSQSVGKISFPNGVTENNHRKADEKRSYSMEKRSENAVLRASSSTDQKGADVMVKPSEKKDLTKKTEVHEKNHRRESVTKSDFPLDSEGIKRNEPMHTTHRSSQEEKKQIGHDKPKYVEGGPRLKERDVDTRNVRVHELSKASVKDLTADGILGKRKDHETNGFLYENGSRPSKMQKPLASPLTSVENGRKLGACQTLPKPVSELQGPTCSNPEVKEHRINGFTDSQEQKNRQTTSSKAKENGEASSAKKRPHSDLKYLDQILNVPQREDLREADENGEQEWLFGQSGVKLPKKPRTDSTASLDESLQVWNQALRIESSDLVALPYVVPF